jgi:hypothetical protein
MKNLKSVLAVITVIGLLFCLTACNSSRYDEAMDYMSKEDYSSALAIFVELGDYKDSAAKAEEAKDKIYIQGVYEEAMKCIEERDYMNAIFWLDILRNNKDAVTKIEEIEEKMRESRYQNAIDYMNHGHPPKKRTH